MISKTWQKRIGIGIACAVPCVSFVVCTGYMAVEAAKDPSVIIAILVVFGPVALGGWIYARADR